MLVEQAPHPPTAALSSHALAIVSAAPCITSTEIGRFVGLATATGLDICRAQSCLRAFLNIVHRCLSKRTSAALVIRCSLFAARNRGSHVSRWCCGTKTHIRPASCTGARGRERRLRRMEEAWEGGRWTKGVVGIRVMCPPCFAVNFVGDFFVVINMNQENKDEDRPWCG